MKNELTNSIKAAIETQVDTKPATKTLADLKNQVNFRSKHYRLGDVTGDEVPCKNFEKNGTYIRVKAPFRPLSDPSGKWYKKETPIFTAQGKLIVENAPYDAQATYKVDQELKDGYWVWTSITKLEKGSL